MTAIGPARSDIDLFAEEVKAEPYPTYASLRDLGRLVYLDRHGWWALTRYDEVRAALRDWGTFRSGHGVVMNDHANREMAGTTTLGSDPPLHDSLRGWYNDRLNPRSLRPVTDFITGCASEIVDEIAENGRFDVADISQRFVSRVICFLVGLPDELAPRLVEWSAAGFEATGPWTPRAEMAVQQVGTMFNELSGLDESAFRFGSIGLGAFLDSRHSEDPGRELGIRLGRFVQPSVHSTVVALSTAVWQLAQHPEQWLLVTRDGAAVSDVYNEALRFQAPFPMFTRVAEHDWTTDDGTIPAGQRVAVILASANRDERHYPAPDTFDLSRDARDHLAFGHGIHTCVGAPLARLELSTFLATLAQRVRFMEAGEPQWSIANSGRILESLHVDVR